VSFQLQRSYLQRIASQFECSNWSNHLASRIDHPEQQVQGHINCRRCLHLDVHYTCSRTLLLTQMIKTQQQSENTFLSRD
jgi:hypothetical protein